MTSRCSDILSTAVPGSPFLSHLRLLDYNSVVRLTLVCSVKRERNDFVSCELVSNEFKMFIYAL